MGMFASNASSRKHATTLIILLLPTILVLIGFFLIPMLDIFRYSFFSFSRGRIVEDLTLDTFRKFFTDPFNVGQVVRTLKMAFVTTCVAIPLGYFTAYALNKVRSALYRKIVTIALFLPLVVSLVVISYGWLVLLSGSGIVNYLVTRLGLVNEPLKLIYNDFGVYIGLIHSLLPFMVFPISGALGQIKPVYKEAAADLGAGWLTTFFRITLPLSFHGVIAGTRLVLTLAMGSFVVPFLLGGGRVNVVGGGIYNNMLNMNWPMAAVATMFLLFLSILILTLLDKLASRFMYLEGAK